MRAKKCKNRTLRWPLVLIAALLVFSGLVFSAQAQEDNGLFFDEHMISQDAVGTYSVHSADLDGDSDMDVLGVSAALGVISWWENDGSENLTEHVISDTYDTPCSVYAADLDGDEDLDVIVAMFRDDVNISWWENDGSGMFTEHTISENCGGACSVVATDMDSDGDMDVLAAGMLFYNVMWWENDGAGDFTEHAIDVEAPLFFPSCARAADLDQDGDTDILGTGFSPFDAILWWENDGNEVFTEHTISDTFKYGTSVYAADLDNDDDMDILGASALPGTITLWENDGSMTFSERSVVEDFHGASSVRATDMDADGDLDVLGAAQVSRAVSWFENDGGLELAEHAISENFAGAFDALTVDLDSDGDMDVLGGALEDGINWWEQTQGGREEHTVTFKAGENGAIRGVKTQYIQDGGACSPVTAVAYDGYEFNEWHGGYTATANPLTIENVTSDMTVTADFIPEENGGPSYVRFKNELACASGEDFTAYLVVDGVELSASSGEWSSCEEVEPGERQAFLMMKACGATASYYAELLVDSGCVYFCRFYKDDSSLQVEIVPECPGDCNTVAPFSAGDSDASKTILMEIPVEAESFQPSR